MSDFDLDGLFVEPRPDEDAWEAFLVLALDHIGGERSDGLTNRQIAELEEVLGCRLPFEVGLLLVMGVPLAEPWRQWAEPAAEMAMWNEQVDNGILFAVEHRDFWFDRWEAKPAEIGDQLAKAREQLRETVPTMFPIYNQRAMPLMAAEGQSNSDGNPVFSIQHAEAIVYGADLAAWMHREFDVPLPMWPTDERHFPFWSDLT